MPFRQASNNASCDAIRKNNCQFLFGLCWLWHFKLKPIPSFHFSSFALAFKCCRMNWIQEVASQIKSQILGEGSKVFPMGPPITEAPSWTLLLDGRSETLEDVMGLATPSTGIEFPSRRDEVQRASPTPTVTSKFLLPQNLLSHYFQQKVKLADGSTVLSSAQRKWSPATALVLL